MSPLIYGAHFAASNFLNTEIILEIGQYLNWGLSFLLSSLLALLMDSEWFINLLYANRIKTNKDECKYLK